MGWFSLRRTPAALAAAVDDLGTGLIALRRGAGDMAPPGTVVVVFNPAGQARRGAAGKVTCASGDTAFCFHPGPYTVDITPFAAAPEWGLRLRFVIDAANPHVPQQRFDLYLCAEVVPDLDRLPLTRLAAAMQGAVQSALAHGALDLPPCTALVEWHAFRAGLNQLLYTRFGVTVDDCVPVDLGDQVDFAAVLQARAQQAAIDEQAALPAAPLQPELHSMSALPPPDVPDVSEVPGVPGIPEVSVTARPPGTQSGAAQPAAAPAAGADAAGLRRLFLELPAVSRDLRLLDLPAGQALFQQHQALLLRLGMASLNVDTMPTLGWAAPDQPLDASGQARRAGATRIAVGALDEAWALLARLQRAEAGDWPALLDDADRMCANLETGLALRRAPHGEPREPAL